MGTERGETVRTLYKAPWVRTDHHSGRQVRVETAKSGAAGSPFSLVSVLICEVYETHFIPGHFISNTCAGRGSPGGRGWGWGAHSPTGGLGRHRDRVGGGGLGWLTPVAHRGSATLKRLKKGNCKIKWMFVGACNGISRIKT